MDSKLENYLEQVQRHLHMGLASERPIIKELRSHLQEKVQELQAQGLEGDQALRMAMDSLGRPRAIARLLYEAHHKVTWPQVAFAALPHVLIAFLFAIHGWDHWLWASLLLLPVVGVTLFGWWWGKPGWVYPWVGYSLIPLALGAYLAVPVLSQAVGFFLSSEPMPNIWAVIALAIYMPVAGWLILSTTIKVVRRNWMLASLMLLPLPAMVTWFALQDQAGGLFGGSTNSLHQLDETMFLVHVALALTTVVFFRLPDRVIKIGGLVAVALFMFAAILHSAHAEIGLLSMGILGLLICALLLAPALIESVADRWEARGRGLRAG